MKVLFVSSMYHRLDRRSSARHIHRQVLALRDRGVEVQVLCPIPYRFRAPREVSSGSPLPASYELDGIVVHHALYRTPPLRWFPRQGVARLARVLVRNGRRIHDRFAFDLVHAKRLFPTATAARRLADSVGVPLVGAAAGSDVHTHPKRGPAWAALVREAIEESDRVVSVSEGLATQIRALGRPKRPVAVVYNGVEEAPCLSSEDQVLMRRSLGLPEEGVGICFVGNLLSAKGVPELLRVFARLHDAHPDAWLVLVGAGPLHGAVAGQSRDPWQARVFAPGPVAHKRVSDWMGASDLLVLPSHDEGLPNVVLEAMASGLPVVATEVGGTAEAVVDGTTGLLVASRDEAGLFDALQRMIRDAHLRRAYGEAGRERVRAHFTWEECGRRLETLYRQVLGWSG